MTDNERAVIGGNAPPPHLEYIERINDLKEEAKNFLDGTPIASDAEAVAVATLLDMASKCQKEAEASRKALTKPLDDQKKVIMDDFRPVDTAATLILTAGKKAQTAWLNKKAAEEQARQAAERERLEAERKRIQDEARAAQSIEDIEAQQEAIEAQLAAEKALERDSKRSVNVSGGGRTIAMVDHFDIKGGPDGVDYVALSKYAWENWRDDLKAWLYDKAMKQIRATRGNTTISGVEIVKYKVARL